MSAKSSADRTVPRRAFDAILPVMAGSWSGYILGPLYATLPKRWRFLEHHGSARFMARCATLSGLIESIVALLVLRYWYMMVFNWLGDAYATKALRYDPGVAAHTAPEIIGGAGFLVIAENPITWMILYFGLEGILRLTAAAITGEAFGILPLCAIDFVFGLVGRGSVREELPLVCDEILRGDASSDLRIASCRSRPDWKYPYTIRYNGTFFQFVADRRAPTGPRPYVYSLRRLPLGEVARGLREYHPDEVLTPVARIESLG